MRADAPLLLVEDDEVDVLTVRRALKTLNVDNPVISAPDAEAALAYLDNHDLEKPWFILLDLNMPGTNGIEFLAHLRFHPHFNDIPVIILTTSNEDSDIQRCFQQGIAGYFVKPVDYERFIDLMRTVIDYWKACEFPVDTR
jgi:CheY-like chemotaxis protein